MRRSFGFLLLGVATVFGWLVASRLPNRIAIHWSLSGEPDGFASKPVALWVLPAIGFAVGGALLAAARFDPASRHPGHAKTVAAIAQTVLAVIAVAHGSIIAVALGAVFDVARTALVATGLVLIVAGNLSPRLRPSRLAGIRTPATLGDAGVWTETQRSAGAWIMVAGAGCLVAAFVPMPARLFALLASIACASIVPVLLSRRIARRRAS